MSKLIILHHTYHCQVYVMENMIVCNVKTNYTTSYIPLSSVCDGKYDCL